MLQYSEKLKSFENINILEPTAGIGNIPMYILQHYKKDYKISMVEIQDENRKVLQDLCNDAPDILASNIKFAPVWTQFCSNFCFRAEMNVCAHRTL